MVILKNKENFIQKGIYMKENGKIVKEKDMEFFILQKEINLKENGKIMK